MTTNLPPHTVAQAITELGADRIKEAWRYLHLWRVLTAAGVPVVDLRHALEYDHDKSEPCDHVERWQAKGGKGLAVLHGTTTGTGKTYAAVRWLIAGVEQGQRVAWLAAVDWPHSGYDRQQEWLDRGRYPRRVVLDDIGAGNTGKTSAKAGDTDRPYSAKPMESMIMGRIGDGLPTLLITNMSKANAKVWLDDRNGSRMQMGGGMFEVKSKVDRRRPDETEVDEHGRSPTWHANAEIIEVIGCRKGDEGLVFGEALLSACALAEKDAALAESKGEVGDAIRWKPIAEAVRVLHLDRDQVFEHAKGMHRREEKQRAAFRADMQRDHGLDVDSMSFGAVAAALLAKSKVGMQVERERRLRVEQDFVAELRRKIPQILKPADVDLARAIAERNGLWVLGNPEDKYQVRCEEGVVRSGIKSSDLAWVYAAMHESKIGAVA